MATSTNQTNLDPALKTLYRADRIEKLTYLRRPMTSLIPKFEGFGGRNMPVVSQFGNPQGVSSDFATAQSNRSEIKVEDFLLTRVNMHSVATIDGETIESTEGDNFSFMRGLQGVIDGALNALSDTIESYISRSGTGSMGAAGTISTTTVTLSNPDDIVNFELGMEVVASATDGGALRSGSATVTGIDRNLGKLTTDSNWTSQITSFAASDFLYRDGDGAAGGSNKAISGFEAWVPESAPSATLFFGVDRTQDTSRLGGQRYDGSSDLMEEALIRGEAVANRENAMLDHYFLNHADYRELKLEVGSKAQYDQTTSNGRGKNSPKIGFKSLVVDGAGGLINCVSANKVEKGVAWGLEIGTWELSTLKQAVRISELDAQKILRQASADGYEVRTVFRGNVCCKAPGRNVRVKLPTKS